MLRAVLLGLLVVSSACSKSSTESAAKVQPGVAAGKVLEVKGTASVKHGDATKPLAVGDTVEGDDTVITGADGNVVIELAHNSARWELGPNKQQKVSESIAWKAQKATAQEIDQATAAAGRPAERNAAGTVATADEAAPAAEPAAPNEAAPPPAAAMAESDLSPKGGSPAPTERKRSRSAPAKAAVATADEEEKKSDDAMPRTTRSAERREVASATASAAPPPAPAAPAAPGGPDLGAPSGGGGGSKVGVMARSVDPIAGALAQKNDALKACVATHGAKESVTLTVEVTNGKATVKLTSKAAVSAALDKCIKGVVGGISFTGSGKATRAITP